MKILFLIKSLKETREEEEIVRSQTYRFHLGSFVLGSVLGCVGLSCVALGSVSEVSIALNPPVRLFALISNSSFYRAAVMTSGRQQRRK